MLWCGMMSQADTRTRGHSLKLIKKRSQKDLRLHFFSKRVVNRWNQLPATALQATSVNSFKERLRKVRTTEIGFFYGHSQCLMSRMVIHDHHHGWGEWVTNQVNDQVNIKFYLLDTQAVVVDLGNRSKLETFF